MDVLLVSSRGLRVVNIPQPLPPVWKVPVRPGFTLKEAPLSLTGPSVQIFHRLSIGLGTVPLYVAEEN